MLYEIYKSLTSNGFTAKDQDKVNNERLGIKKTFKDEQGRYIEIYKEDWGWSVLIYGKRFMKGGGHYPSRYDITESKDIKSFKNEVEKQISR